MPNHYTTSTDRLYEELKHDVVTCALLPGKSLSEVELGERYRTSRTPVREACRQLANEGLITIIPFRGYFVAPLTPAEFHNLQEAQLVVDTAVAGIAAERATPPEIAQMEKLARHGYKTNDKKSHYQFLEFNRQLHITVAHSTRNDYLAGLVSDIHTRLMRYFYLGLTADSFGGVIVKEHAGIVDAIRRGDADEARRRTHEHIANTMRRSANLFAPGGRWPLSQDEPADTAATPTRSTSGRRNVFRTNA